MDGFEAHEVVEGQVEVTGPDGTVLRVLIPAGVGVPGADDQDLAIAVVAELCSRGTPARVLDVSQLLARDPELLRAVTERLDTL